MEAGLRGVAVSAAWESPRTCKAGDPYLRWQELEGWHGLLPPGKEAWVPLLVQRQAKSTWAGLRKRLPSLRLSAEAHDDFRVATAWLPADQLPSLEPLVQAMELSLPSTAGRAPGYEAAWPDLPELPSQPVVVGVIDQGGAPLHAAFRDP